MRKWHENKILLRVGVFSSSREISARLVEVERQPEGDEQDEEGANANRERERERAKQWKNKIQQEKE